VGHKIVLENINFRLCARNHEIGVAVQGGHPLISKSVLQTSPTLQLDHPIFRLLYVPRL
jgi:hypothetical protein